MDSQAIYAHDPDATYDSDISESDDSEDEQDATPEYPYNVGSIFLATRCTPPPPDYGNPPVSDIKDWKNLSPLEHCLASSASKAIDHGGDELPLRITSHVRVGNKVGAQLVIVNGDMLAKIFDPFYYDHFQEWSDPRDEKKTDIVGHAEENYLQEVAAFVELQQSPEARQFIPEYHGSWTIQVDTSIGKLCRGVTQARSVQLVLMEYIHGKCMQSVDPRSLTRKVRTCIVKEILRADAILAHAGVEHNDMYPRNIMIVGSDYLTPQLDIKILDFGISNVLRLQKTDTADKIAEVLRHRYPGKIRSPIDKWSRSMLVFSKWVGRRHSSKEGEKWLWKHFHKDKLYMPVVMGE